MRDPGPPPLLGTVEEILDWGRRFKAKKKWDKEHTYVIDIITILYGRMPYMRKVDLDAAMLDKRHAGGEPIPKKFAETVQSVINHYTSQSDVFRKLGRGSEDDLFYSPKGKGSGTWALHTERAVAWLKRKIDQDL